MANQPSSKNKDFVPRCPIVTVLGHVNHGKTTLLDIIRKTNVAAKEYGGITQHTGAYQIEVKSPASAKATADRQKSKVPGLAARAGKSQIEKITFIDTPGHEAFAKMRSRGAKVADIAVLVIAGNDGVMPQTIESINYIKSAKIPCIIVINKIDLPNVNIDKIKKQLAKQKLQLEESGGDIPVVLLSAKTGQGVDKLLEMILLLTELFQVKEDTPGKLKGVVIESSLSNNRGPVASIVVRSGTLHTRDSVVCEKQEFRVRGLTDFLRHNLETVSAGEAVEVLGWKTVPAVGSIFLHKQLQLSRVNKREIAQTSQGLSVQIPPKIPALESERLKLIIKTDTNGTLEAVLDSLPDKTLVIAGRVGTINESDILLAKTTGAIVIGFNVKVDNAVVKLAESEKVTVKTYNLIYNLIQEIEEAIEAKLKSGLENIAGEAKILAIFDIRDQMIAGVKVIKGRLSRGDKVKIIRGEKEIGRARIKSLRHDKEDITNAHQGTEAGVLLSSKIELLTGDGIIAIG